MKIDEPGWRLVTENYDISAEGFDAKLGEAHRDVYNGLICQGVELTQEMFNALVSLSIEVDVIGPFSYIGMVLRLRKDYIAAWAGFSQYCVTGDINMAQRRTNEMMHFISGGLPK